MFAVLLLHVACAGTAPPLNSDLIRERYGSYGIEVLEDDGRFRRSMLYSSENGERVMRTYAVVVYEPLLDADALAVAGETAAIRAGASLGSTFADSGWTVRKEPIHKSMLGGLPPGHAVPRLMQLEAPVALPLYVYRLVVGKNGHAIAYAVIGEAYHPEFMSEAEIMKRYPAPVEAAPPAVVQGIVNAMLEPF